MIFERISASDINDLAMMAHELWPDATIPELLTEFRERLSSDKDLLYICKRKDHSPVGFIHLSLRMEYVEGVSSFPVGYVEGIYVRKQYRRKGIASQLLRLGESWALEKGCTDLASDSEIRNPVSHPFHLSAGFCEVNRIVCYVKPIRNKS